MAPAQGSSPYFWRRFNVQRGRTIQRMNHGSGFRGIQLKLGCLCFEQRGRGSKGQSILFFVSQPNGHRKRLKHLRNEFDEHSAELSLFDTTGSSFGERSPNGAVIIKRPLKLADAKAL